MIMALSLPFLMAIVQTVPEAPTPNLLEPNLGLVFWTAVTFGIVLYILWKYAWGPITNALEQREQNISESIQRAEKALAEAKQVQADNQKARREAEREAQRILREARESAEALREDEVDKTREKIRQMQEQAQAEIEREKQGALEELREEVADLAIQAASKILEEDMNQDRQRRLVDDFIDDLPKN
jgi:F-type H+-transporting ATPase subunit b